MNDLSDYEWVREEALAQKQKQSRIFANHMRHPDPRDPDHVEGEDDELETCNQDFHLNGQTFETKEEAEHMARDIFNRWMLATDHKAVESDEPANYRIINGVLEPIQKEAAA